MMFDSIKMNRCMNIRGSVVTARDMLARMLDGWIQNG